MKLERALLFPLLLTAGCGSRSGLYDAPADTPDKPVTPVKPMNGCAADLLAGAPTPMKGYCPTHDNVAPGLAPSAPQIAQTVTLGSQGVTYSTDMVVDPTGRVFAAFDANAMGGVTPRNITAVEPDGTIAWATSFDFSVGALFLDADGHLRVRAYDGASTLLTLDRDGNSLSKISMPANQFGGFAVGVDGSLFTLVTDFKTTDMLAKLTPEGSPLWTAPIDNEKCHGCVSEVTLAAGDRPVVATSWTTDGGATWFSRLIAFTAGGAVAWEHDMNGLYTQGPAAAQDGTLRIAVGQGSIGTNDYTTILYAFGADGTVLWQTDTHDDPEQTWGNPLVVAPSGTTLVHAFGGLDAVDAKGHLLWHHAAQTNLYYDAFVDPKGTLVVQVDGKVLGLDMETGAGRWTLDVAQFPYGLALGPSGSLAVFRGNELLLARDP